MVVTSPTDIDNPNGFDAIFGQGAFADREAQRSAAGAQTQRQVGT
jgi:hypothetical protein